jgi:hypothetical protein
MHRKSTAIFGAVTAAIALVALMAVPAFAGTVTVNLAVSPTTAAYAHEVVIAPSIIGTETLPGDAITLETWDSVESTWTLFGEGLKVEDTGTVVPQYIMVDETFLPWHIGNAWTPVVFRATYKPVSRAKDASGTAIASPSVKSADAGPSFTVKKVSKVSLTTKLAKTVKHGRVFNVQAQTTDVGIGNVRITVAKSGFKTKTIKVSTDDSGYANQGVKLTKKGRYKVSVVWLGNFFGAASKTVTKYISVR